MHLGTSRERCGKAPPLATEETWAAPLGLGLWRLPIRPQWWFTGRANGQGRGWGPQGCPQVLLWQQHVPRTASPGAKGMGTQSLPQPATRFSCSTQTLSTWLCMAVSSHGTSTGRRAGTDQWAAPAKPGRASGYPQSRKRCSMKTTSAFLVCSGSLEGASCFLLHRYHSCCDRPHPRALPEPSRSWI